METTAKLYIKDTRGDTVSTIGCRTNSIGAGGAFFNTSTPLKGNTRVAVELTLAADRKGCMFPREEECGCCVFVNGTVLRSGPEGMAIGFDDAYQVVPLQAMLRPAVINQLVHYIGKQQHVSHTSHSRKGGEVEYRSLGKMEVDNQTVLIQGGEMMNKVMQFLRDEEGSNAIEYGLIAVLIALAIIVGAQAVGTSLDGMFNDASTTLDQRPAAT